MHRRRGSGPKYAVMKDLINAENYKAMREVLSAGNTTDVALMIKHAIAGDKIKVLQFILPQATFEAVNSDIVIHELAASKSMEIFNLLLEHLDLANRDLLSEVVQAGWYEPTKFLLMHADGDDEDIIRSAVHSGNIDIVDLFKDFPSFQTAEGLLTLAIENDDIDMVPYLTSHGIMPTHDDIYETIEHDNVDILKNLLDYIQEDIDLLIVTALSKSSCGIAQLLLDMGANIHSHEHTIMFYAAQCHCPDIVKMLIDRGINVSIDIDNTIRGMVDVWQTYADDHETLSEEEEAILEMLIEKDIRFADEELLEIAINNQWLRAVVIILDHLDVIPDRFFENYELEIVALKLFVREYWHPGFDNLPDQVAERVAKLNFIQEEATKLIGPGPYRNIMEEFQQKRKRGQ